jgi:glyoxylase-like metal-dependent hydrolase (beta-lactamase superfamily II)
MLSRRDFLRLTGATAAASPWLTTLFQSAAQDAGTFRSMRRNVGIYRQRGGTIGWLINDGGMVVVDTQFPESARACWAGMQERGDGPLAYAINTHHHGDHTGGNPVFKPEAGALVAQARVPELQRQSAEESGTVDQQAFAETTFEETWTAEVGDETLRLEHYGPAHTGGDAIIHFQKANIVHMGDLIFNRVYPYIDVGGGASTEGWIGALEAIHDTYDDDTQFIFGHGPSNDMATGTRDDLLVMRDFLSALSEYVRSQRNAGASLEEMKQKDVLEGFEAFDREDWSLQLGQCIQFVYNDQTSG